MVRADWGYWQACLPLWQILPGWGRAVTRRFRFERGNGMWQINGKFMDSRRGAPPRFRVKRNSVERWVLRTAMCDAARWEPPAEDLRPRVRPAG